MRHMGTIYLVRHGQASFGAADYDQLSPLGERQCHALGEHLRAQRLQFQAVLRGSLRRHQQSLASLQAGFCAAPGAPASAWPPALEWPGLNEYDGDVLVRAAAAAGSGIALPDAHTPEGFRQHFRLLRVGLLGWMDGSCQPPGLPTYADWAGGVMAALDHVRAHYTGDVLIVSSGGPISTLVAQLLGAPAASSVELNLRIRNSAVTELAYNPKRCSLVVFNHLPHLPMPERAGWITAA